MRRPAHQERTLARLAAWRAVCPDLAVRSTFIVGFPGETEEDFAMLLDWLKEAKLARVGCFKYEAVEGAAANVLGPAVPEEVKEERWHRFMAAQQEVSRALMAERVGATIDVIVDEVDGERVVGRSKWDAPQIDGSVVLGGAQHVQAGDIVAARVTRADAYDLWADVATPAGPSRGNPGKRVRPRRRATA
jgi:ribosomal protein S12 methylthiotransferase